MKDINEKKDIHLLSFNEIFDIQRKDGFGFLGASLGVFAARTLASAAISTAGKAAAGFVYKNLFSKKVYGDSATPSSCVKVSNAQVVMNTKLVAKDVVDLATMSDATDLMEASMLNVSDSFSEPSQAGAFLEKALDNCMQAILKLNNNDTDPTWIGGYYNAASQYIYISRLIIANESDETRISELKLTLSNRINQFLQYVNNDEMNKNIIDKIDEKFSEVTSYNSNWDQFFYTDSDEVKPIKVLAEHSENEALVNVIRGNFSEAEKNLALSSLVQSDVINQWEMLLEDIKPN